MKLGHTFPSNIGTTPNSESQRNRNPGKRLDAQSRKPEPSGLSSRQHHAEARAVRRERGRKSDLPKDEPPAGHSYILRPINLAYRISGHKGPKAQSSSRGARPSGKDESARKWPRRLIVRRADQGYSLHTHILHCAHEESCAGGCGGGVVGKAGPVSQGLAVFDFQSRASPRSIDGSIDRSLKPRSELSAAMQLDRRGFFSSPGPSVSAFRRGGGGGGGGLQLEL